MILKSATANFLSDKLKLTKHIFLWRNWSDAFTLGNCGSQGLLKSVKQENKLYKQYLSNPSLWNEANYKAYKNKLNHSLRIVKRLYFDKKLSESKSNIRATWRLFNSKKLRPKPNSVFKVDDQDVSDPMKIANRFCYYFSNIGPNLAKRIQPTTSYKNFLSGHFPQSMFLKIEKAGYDNIPMSIIKRSICSVSSPLTHIVNLSITHGIVPDELKIARVVPIVKSGDKALFSNYRPISVLPCFSRFLERIIYNRITNCLNDLDVLCDNQYGFRKNRSPSLARFVRQNFFPGFLLHLIGKKMLLEYS